MNDIIKTELGTYKKVLVTDEFIYYVNYDESDENGNTIMYRNSNNELVSDNYFAFCSYLEDMKKLIKNELIYSFVDTDSLEE